MLNTSGYRVVKLVQVTTPRIVWLTVQHDGDTVMVVSRQPVPPPHRLQPPGSGDQGLPAAPPAPVRPDQAPGPGTSLAVSGAHYG